MGLAAEVVSPGDGVLRGYKVIALDPAKRLTQVEQEFVSQFGDPQGTHNLLRLAAEFGLLGGPMKVEVEFPSGHRGGLLFRPV